MAFSRSTAQIDLITLSELTEEVEIAEQVLQIEGFDYEPDEDYLQALHKCGAIHTIIWPAPVGTGIWMAVTFLDDRTARHAWAEIHESEYYGCQLAASLVSFPERDIQEILANVNLPITAFKPQTTPARSYSLPESSTDVSSDSN